MRAHTHTALLIKLDISDNQSKWDNAVFDFLLTVITGTGPVVAVVIPLFNDGEGVEELAELPQLPEIEVNELAEMLENVEEGLE